MFGSRAWSFGYSFRNIRNTLKNVKNANAKTQVKSMSSTSNVNAAASKPVGGILSNPVVKSAFISGSLSLAGDLVAQLLANYDAQSDSSYDIARAARMGSFGLFFYGPFQHYWYMALEKAFKARTVTNFAFKITLNQLCLAPVVISGLFAWNLMCQGKLSEWKGKIQRDFEPTLYTGWKFWIPAASVNFVLVPLQHQVLYMSTCGVVWTAILSKSSSNTKAIGSPVGDDKNKKKKNNKK